MNSTEDSLKVIENEDGSFTISWDENDPIWAFLNDLTEQERQDWFIDVVDKYAQEILNKNIVTIEEDPITGELYLPLSQDIIDKVDWKENDELEWIDNKDGTFSVRKVDK